MAQTEHHRYAEGVQLMTGVDNVPLHVRALPGFLFFSLFSLLLPLEAPPLLLDIICIVGMLLGRDDA